MKRYTNEKYWKASVLKVPQSYDKVVISNEQVSTEKVEIEGRKVPLESIRKKIA